MANFLLEVGTEELPADFVSSAIAQWQVKIPQTLSEVFLTPKAIEVYGTPRRLAVLIKDIPQNRAIASKKLKVRQLKLLLKMVVLPKPH